MTTTPAPTAALPSGVTGLRTWIWYNNARSIAMLVAFPLLLSAVVWVLSVAFVIIMADEGDRLPEVGTIYSYALPVAATGATIWFAIAFLIQRRAMLRLAGAKIERDTEAARRVRRLLEPLAISRGIPTPEVAIMPTAGLNAFATGWSTKDAVIGVTTGLLDHLDDDELEAVLAHEMTHVLNRDTRVLIVSIVFVGIFALSAELAFRMLQGTRSDSKKAFAFLLAAAVVLAIGRFAALLLRFGISRKREFVADAGAVQLTKKPQALLSALQKISANPQIGDVSDDVQQMMIFDPPDGWDLFSTHPAMTKRIAAIQAIG